MAVKTTRELFDEKSAEIKKQTPISQANTAALKKQIEDLRAKFEKDKAELGTNLLKNQKETAEAKRELDEVKALIERAKKFHMPVDQDAVAAVPELEAKIAKLESELIQLQQTKFDEADLNRQVANIQNKITEEEEALKRLSAEKDSYSNLLDKEEQYSSIVMLSSAFKDSHAEVSPIQDQVFSMSDADLIDLCCKIREQAFVLSAAEIANEDKGTKGTKQNMLLTSVRQLGIISPVLSERIKKIAEDFKLELANASINYDDLRNKLNRSNQSLETLKYRGGTADEIKARKASDLTKISEAADKAISAHSAEIIKRRHIYEEKVFSTEIDNYRESIKTDPNARVKIYSIINSKGEEIFLTSTDPRETPNGRNVLAKLGYSAREYTSPLINDYLPEFLKVGRNGDFNKNLKLWWESRTIARGDRAANILYERAVQDIDNFSKIVERLTNKGEQFKVVIEGRLKNIDADLKNDKGLGMFYPIYKIAALTKRLSTSKEGLYVLAGLGVIAAPVAAFGGPVAGLYAAGAALAIGTGAVYISGLPPKEGGSKLGPRLVSAGVAIGAAGALIAPFLGASIPIAAAIAVGATTMGIVAKDFADKKYTSGSLAATAAIIAPGIIGGGWLGSAIGLATQRGLAAGKWVKTSLAHAAIATCVWGYTAAQPIIKKIADKIGIDMIQTPNLNFSDNYSNMLQAVKDKGEEIIGFSVRKLSLREPTHDELKDEYKSLTVPSTNNRPAQNNSSGARPKSLDDILNQPNTKPRTRTKVPTLDELLKEGKKTSFIENLNEYRKSKLESFAKDDRPKSEQIVAERENKSDQVIKI